MTKLAVAVLTALFLIAAAPVRAETATPVALTPAPEPAVEETYFGLSKETALTVAAVGAVTVVGGAVVAYSVAGASGLLATAATIYASHFVVEAALLAGAGSAWLGFVAKDEARPTD